MSVYSGVPADYNEERGVIPVVFFSITVSSDRKEENCLAI